jgi:hypothetical protein
MQLLWRAEEAMQEALKLLAAAEEAAGMQHQGE